MSSAAFAGRGTKLQFENVSSQFVDLAEIRTVDFTGSKYDLADVTNMDSGTFREWLPTLADSGEVSFNGNYIPSDTSQQELTAMFNAATLSNWKVVLPGNRGTITFLAYVSSLDRAFPVDKEATIAGKLKITGPITITS
jgi:predicted secreted protein